MADPVGMKLMDITYQHARDLLAEHEKPEGQGRCGCDRCIVLRKLLKSRELADHVHHWTWIETELGGEWATPGRRWYECSCGAAKSIDADGTETIEEPVGDHHIISPADAAQRYWKPEIMPKTMKRLE